MQKPSWVGDITAVFRRGLGLYSVIVGGFISAVGAGFNVFHSVYSKHGGWHWPAWYWVLPLVFGLLIAEHLVIRERRKEKEVIEKERDQAIKERDDAKKAEAPGLKASFRFDRSTIHDIGQFYAEGPAGGGGAISITPRTMELQRRQLLLQFLVKLYMASHPEASPGITGGFESLPKDWVEERLEEQGESWRLNTYSLSVSPQELMGDDD